MLDGATLLTTVTPAGDSGRALDHGDQPAGPTTLAILDLPPLGGDVPDRPRLWLAGAGTSSGWRRAGIAISLDDGASYESVGSLSAPVVMGRAMTLLPSGVATAWDHTSSVDVELLADSMWLESRSRDAVLAGANVAALGDELIQFADVQPLGQRRFRLSTLLRGRRGSEWAATGHAVDDRFVLLDLAAMLPLSLPLEHLGETILVRAGGAGDGGAPALAATIGGTAIRPLAPVHLRWERSGGQLLFRWIPQSRSGFGWPDLTDVPLGEATAAWRVVLRDGSGVVTSADVATPEWSTPDRPGPLWLDVAQIGLTLGRTATLTIA